MSAPSTSPRLGLLLLGGIGLCSLAFVAVVRLSMAYEKVLFVNGLDSEVTVSAGGKRFTLDANGHRLRRLPVGPLEVDVRNATGPLAHETVFVTDEGGLFIYNLLGAAPLYSTTVRYSRTQDSNGAPDSQPLSLGGKVFQRVGQFDYVLTDPPERMSVRSESGRSITRTHLGRFPGGWTTTFGMLMDSRQTAEANQLAEALWRALPETRSAEEAAFVSRLSLARKEGLLASVAVSRAWRDAHRDDLTAHRLWASEMRRAERNDEVRAYYVAELEREPGAVVMAIMLSRYEPAGEGTKRLEALMRDHPGEPLPRKALALRYVRQQRWADALPLLEAMEQQDSDYALVLDMHAETLVALGRREEAARKVSERLLKAGAKDDTVNPDDVLLYAKLVGGSSQKGKKNAVMRQLITWASKKPADAVVSEWVAASLGEPVVSPESSNAPSDNVLAAATRVLMALAEEPKVAARDCADIEFSVFRRMGTDATLLLAAESERLGDSALAARILDVSAVEMGFGELQDVVHGKLPLESLPTLDWGERAALSLVVARRLDAEGVDSKAAYARVKREALLPGPVTAALEHWARPKPSSAVAGDTEP
ncbi:hypothetical protein [Corallococcus sp. Z5C101001]|uniref:hypothetical protein n=1 Tax=Corallococcus sp. Z5C101001 TaxID=2596829 RepID=UPI00117DC896|nr:hypothetical protein [Corallococcus sp. Z5C101001]TSC32204.1 hypothetical protein FOF48_09150 [Corallococcus sp. Z5C101001]